MSDKYNKLEHTREQSSVEHVMPKTINASDWSGIESGEQHEEWLHKLGNIVLLNRRKNSAISNSSFKNKKEKYSEAIENNSYASSVFLKNDEWTIEKIKENHNKALGLLRKYYEGNSLETLLGFHKK